MTDLLNPASEESETTPSDAVVWFEELRATDRPRVGGKCASLGELIHAGIPVPPGFAVTVDAWEQVIEFGDLRERITGLTSTVDPGDIAALREVQRRALQIIAAAPLPPHIEQAIRDGYTELCRRAGRSDLPVAVRSSAVAEDGVASSFAGQQETYLWIVGSDEVIARMRDCWASLFTPQAIAYRAKLEEPARSEAVLMSVAVQEMVDAEVAGVGFTVSPRTGDPSVMAVNASWGLGETVVSGQVTPDEYWIDKIDHTVRSCTITNKEVRCVPSATGNGTETADVPEDLAARACLDEALIAELAAIMVRVEKHYGSAQDIEWALAREPDGRHRFMLLQSRPETVVAARAAAAAAPKAAGGVASYLSVVQSLSGKVRDVG